MVAGFGKYRNCVGRAIMDSLPIEDFMMVKKVYRVKDQIISKDKYASYYGSSSGIEE